MPRPKIFRCMCFRPKIFYFKPRGVPMRMLNETVIEKDEIEALKLHDVDGLDQVQAAKKMKISQPTFTRVLDSAYKKIAKAIIKGMAIRINT